MLDQLLVSRSSTLAPSVAELLIKAKLPASVFESESVGNEFTSAYVYRCEHLSAHEDLFIEETTALSSPDRKEINDAMRNLGFEASETSKGVHTVYLPSQDDGKFEAVNFSVPPINKCVT